MFYREKVSKATVMQTAAVDGSAFKRYLFMVRRTRGGKKMKFKPLGERALVKIIEREEQTASGIVLPDTAKDKPQTAEVVAVGQFEDGIKVDTGQMVVLRKFAGTEVKLNGEEHLIVEAKDILGVVAE